MLPYVVMCWELMQPSSFTNNKHRLCQPFTQHIALYLTLATDLMDLNPPPVGPELPSELSFPRAPAAFVLRRSAWKLRSN
jgi:hypothetical protein